MGPLPRTEDQVGDYAVKTTKFACTRALPMWIRVGRIVEPALKSLEGLDEATVKALVAKGGSDLVSKALHMIAPLLATLDDGAVMRLACDLLATTTVTGPDGKEWNLGGQEAKIAAAFGEDLLGMLRVCWFVASYNFSSFLTAAGGSDARPPAADPST